MSTKHVLFDSAVKKEIQEHYDKHASIYDSEDSIDFRPETTKCSGTTIEDLYAINQRI